MRISSEKLARDRVTPEACHLRSFAIEGQAWGENPDKGELINRTDRSDDI